MTPAEKEQLWNCIMKMRSMPWRGPRGGVYNWDYRQMRKLYEKLVVYGDANEPTAAWRLLNEGKYKYMIYPWYKAQLYKCAGFSPISGTCCYYAVFDANLSYTIYDGVSYIGLDADNVGDVVMPALGGFGNVLINNLSTNATTCTLGFILNPGDPIPTVDIKDNLGNPVVLNWVPYCSSNCYSITIPVSDPIVFQIDTSVEGYILQAWPIMTGTPPSPLDLSDFAALSNYGGYILTRLYGPQCVFFVDNDGVSFKINISNIYTSGPISFITATTTYTSGSGTCLVKPKTYCYFITELTGTCNFSYQNLYGYIFNNTSQSTPIGVCAIEGTVTPDCVPGVIAISGGTVPCVTDFSCIPPPPPNCLYSGFFDPYNFAGYSDLFGWTLNGNDLLTELNSLMSSSAGSVWAGFVDNGYFIFYGTWFYYYGPDLGQLDFIAPDLGVYPVVMTPVNLVGLSCDTLKCYQVEITGTAIKLSSVLFASALTGGTSAVFASSPPVYANIDSDDQVTLQQVFQLIYGPQCYVSVLTIGGNDTITIYDAYDFGPPTLSDTIGGTYTGTYITC